MLPCNGADCLCINRLFGCVAKHQQRRTVRASKGVASSLAYSVENHPATTTYRLLSAPSTARCSAFSPHTNEPVAQNYCVCFLEGSFSVRSVCWPWPSPGCTRWGAHAGWWSLQTEQVDSLGSKLRENNIWAVNDKRCSQILSSFP